MAIFSRRTIQRLINENAAFMRGKQIKEHVTRLNLHNESVLDTEWEVVLLNAFSKFGKVEHEPDWGGTRPDIYFTSLLEPRQSFIADIVTVSDKGIEAQFPVKELFNEGLRIAKEHGLRENSFAIEIKHRDEDDDDNEELRPSLPGRARFQQTILGERFSRFIEEIVQAPNEPRSLPTRYEDTDVLLTYHPTQEFAMMSFPAYKEPASLTRNTVYYRLEEKAGKLSRSGYTKGPQAIIVCDGGNDLLRSGHRWGTNHVGKVIRTFLKNHPSISFVLTVVVKQRVGDRRRNQVITTLYEGLSFELVGKNMTDSINGLVEVIPKPERDAANAINLINGSIPHEGESFYGGYEITDDQIRISARTLLDFLAGRISRDEFFGVYHFMPGGDAAFNTLNPFDRKRGKGRLITEVIVEKAGIERDDDWVAIRFGAPDPAITCFRVPERVSADKKASGKKNKSNGGVKAK